MFIGALSVLRSHGGVDVEVELERIHEIIRTQKEDLEEQLRDVRLNWAPLLRAIFFHTPVLEKVYLLVSHQSVKDKQKLLRILDEYKRITGEDFEVSFSEPVDFNSYEDIHFQLKKNIKEVKRNGYRDTDISIYISGGTSAVTLALTLLAVKEGRQVEYLPQLQGPGNAEIVSINVGMKDIFAFAPELRGRCQDRRNLDVYINRRCQDGRTYSYDHHKQGFKPQLR
ncbi:MAG: hypothetical protein Q9N34_09330 [Aquificota bacterium]|nr:hypothetical protein [Aquificota bacterium]